VYYNIRDYTKFTKVPIMENSSIFWNKIADWLSSLGITYISPTVAVLVLAAAFLVLLFILWLIFRKLRLWYWKTNIQIDTLKSIDVRLHNVEEKLAASPVMVAGKADGKMPEQDAGSLPSETVQETAEPEDIGLTIVGKSGRVYTEAELELQIRE
jgi:hypothetical protein